LDSVHHDARRLGDVVAIIALLTIF